MEQQTMNIKGFRFSAVAAGIKHAHAERLDLGLVMADQPCVAAGVFTTNLVKAAPVIISVERLGKGLCQAVLMNSGNANACTGAQGKHHALDLTAELARGLKIDPELAVPMSTGVIGNPLPIDRMKARIPELVEGLEPGRFLDVARAIMTTDTTPKTVSFDTQYSKGSFRMLGLAKGSGMIAPRMATMLAVIVTDIRVDRDFLSQCLSDASAGSFNRITVDGDTSTNDSVVVMAGGHPDAAHLPDLASDREIFSSTLRAACLNLARQIARDGEGATKLVEVNVCGAADMDSAERVARTIADSPLVKTAFNGGDPNWGRIMAAAGRAGVDFDPDIVDLYIGQVQVLKDGALASESWEQRSAAVMKESEFSIKLDLKKGSAEVTFLTTDFSKEYVAINADYRS